MKCCPPSNNEKSWGIKGYLKLNDKEINEIYWNHFALAGGGENEGHASNSFKWYKVAICGRYWSKGQKEEDGQTEQLMAR